MFPFHIERSLQHKVLGCCNPMSIWESFLHDLEMQLKKEKIYVVAIPFIYGSMPACAEGNVTRERETGKSLGLTNKKFITIPFYVFLFPFHVIRSRQHIVLGCCNPIHIWEHACLRSGKREPPVPE